MKNCMGEWWSFWAVFVQLQIFHICCDENSYNWVTTILYINIYILYYATIHYTTLQGSQPLGYQTFSYSELSCGSGRQVRKCASPLAQAESKCVYLCFISVSGGYTCPPLAQMELHVYLPPTQTHSFSSPPPWATKLERLGNSLCYAMLCYVILLYCTVLHYTILYIVMKRSTK